LYHERIHIYIIRNRVNGKFYIGSTKNYHVRKLKHFNELRKNKHHSIHLQRAFNKYSEKEFEFIIIETCYNYLKREQYLFDNVIDFKDTYNISKMATGGDNIYNHPNRDEIIKKLTEQLLKAPRRKKSYEGSNNPNWKGGLTFCECGNRINSTSKTCIQCQDKTGKNNPFYGKKHSKESKEKMRLASLNRYNGNQEKIVIIDNIEYHSMNEASRKLKIPSSTIHYRIKSKNVKFDNYKYK
jgi:group I intron endonuclease